MKAAAGERVAVGQTIHGAPQSRPARAVADSLVLIWSATEFEEWRDQIVYLPL